MALVYPSAIRPPFVSWATSQNVIPAGITFWDVAHETNGGLIADGYTRATGKMSMVIAQNGPGITGLVTPIKTAYWNHTPLLLVTPQAAA